MTILITAEMLRDVGACAPGLAWLSEHHPAGATWRDLVASLAHRPFWSAWLGCYCPGDVEGATWDARLALQSDDEDRAWLGWRCPAGVAGATWEARLALQRGDYDRACLGWLCPAGVEGATWEARLALQRDDYDRACLVRYCPAGVEGDPRSHRAHAIDLDELDDVEPCELCGERPVTHIVRCSDGSGYYGYCDICDPPRDGDIP